MNKGKITQIIGPVVDVRFEENLPSIYNALFIENENGEKIVLEVNQHLGLNEVRTISMSSTDGLKRGQDVLDSGNPISVPVGENVLGRMFDVNGNPIDKKPFTANKLNQIHKKTPLF